MPGTQGLLPAPSCRLAASVWGVASAASRSPRSVRVLAPGLLGADGDTETPAHREDTGWLRGKGQQLRSCPGIVLPAQSLSPKSWIPPPARCG